METITKPDIRVMPEMVEGTLNGNVPEGPIQEKWDTHRFNMKLVNPSNRRKFNVIIVGSGLAGASAAASMGEMGYNIDCFCYQDSPRRAHSVAAQGGINAAKNYPNDGDSTFRLFYDTVKGGDYRAREANVYRLAQISNNIIDQCVAQGVPFAREYGGMLANRSFGGAQVSRTFYARGQTGQQLLLGAYQSLSRQIHNGQVTMHTRTEMLDLIVIDGRARGIVVRDMVTGEISSHMADAVVLATGGYSNVFYLSTNAMGCNNTAVWRSYKRGALFANPCFTQIHPTCIPPSGEHQSKLTLMSESLRNDGRIWVPRSADESRPVDQIPEEDRYYYLEEKYPSFGNLVPRDVASRNAKTVVDEGLGVGELKNGVYLDFAESIGRLGEKTIRERYGNLFDMYANITGEDPYKVPMRIYPALHYTMGGLWVDYNLMSNIPGLFVIGEANFSDHGANRLGASALMQGHRELGKIVWEYCGMERNEAGLQQALEKLPVLREEFWQNVNVPGESGDLNQSLEKAGRVADFLEMGELMCYDALQRAESCGGHFRSESQTEEGEALRDDENFAYSAAWEYTGESNEPLLNKEMLTFEHVPLSQRSYK